MSRKFLMFGLSAVLAVSFHCIRAVGGAAPDRPDPTLTVGAFTAEGYTEGIGDVVLPLYFNGHGLFFLNPRMSFTDRSAEEYNLGMGYRHLLFDNRALVGANVFYDRRDTSSGATFNQVGFGAEYLSHFLDARANIYVPLESRQCINEFSTEQQSVTRNSRSSTQILWEDDPYGWVHSVLQDYSIHQTTETRTTTTTTTMHFREYEVALRGWDAELGTRLPLPPLDDYLRLKPFAGFYRYEGRHGIRSVDGFRGRLEMHVKPSFFVDAVYYSDNELTGGNWSLGAYVAVPLDLQALGNRRNPFAGASERWQAGKDGDVSYRLASMIKRDPQIRSRIAEPEEQEELRTTTSSTVTRQDTRKVGEGTVELLANVVFVDGDRGDDGNPGTFEAPKLTIQGGVDAANSPVVVFPMAGGVEYQDNVELRTGVQLYGACAIQGFEGRRLGGRPRVDALVPGPTIQMENNTRVTGFEIMNTLGGNGIHAVHADHLVITRNRFHTLDRGVNIQSSLGGDVHVTLKNNEFSNYTESGAVVSGVTIDPGTYFLHARNNTFEGGQVGLQIQADGYEDAMAIVHGLDVTGATAAGVFAQLHNSGVTSALGLADIRANNNPGFGIAASLTSDGSAMLLAGMPKVLMELAGGALSVAGPLSPELAAFMAASGPIEANHNGFGLLLNVEATGLAALAMLDVHANNNAIYGATALVTSTDSLAVGLAGSSENFIEVLQLGANIQHLLPLPLLPLNLPDLPPPAPMGPSQFSNNELGHGLSMTVNGHIGALAAVLGVEANHNDFGSGVNLTAKSADGLALAGLARIQADNNRIMGINVDVEADTLALGALFDFHAVNNSTGVHFSVEGAGAIGLMGSTDPFRSLADALSDGLALAPPLVVPGTPFGQSVVSDNELAGILAGVRGDSLALGAFLDIDAQNNGQYGLRADLQAASGDAIGLFGSSDMLFERVPPVLGEALYGDPDALLPVPYEPMGEMDLSGNERGGLWARLAADQNVYVLAGGITADNNQAIGGDGHGVHFDLTATEGAIFAGLMNIMATGNAGHGIHIEALGDQTVTLALIESLAVANDGCGIRMDARSDSDNLYAILAGVGAHVNAAEGFDLRLEAAEELGVAMTALYAAENAGHGLQLAAQSGGDGFVWMGEEAIDALRDVFGDYDLFGASESLYNFMPTGSSEFIGNAETGLDLLLEVGEGDAHIAISAVTASENEEHGIRLRALSLDGDVSAEFVHIEANNNEQDGLHIDLDISAGGPDFVSLLINHSEAMWNGGWDLYARLRHGLGGGMASFLDFVHVNQDFQFVP